MWLPHKEKLQLDLSNLSCALNTFCPRSCALWIAQVSVLFSVLRSITSHLTIGNLWRKVCVCVFQW